MGLNPLTSRVHYKVPGAELVTVEVLDGNDVVGSDPLLHTAVLPHHVRPGLGGDHLHGNPTHNNLFKSTYMQFRTLTNSC